METGLLIAKTKPDVGMVQLMEPVVMVWRGDPLQAAPTRSGVDSGGMHHYDVFLGEGKGGRAEAAGGRGSLTDRPVDSRGHMLLPGFDHPIFQTLNFGSTPLHRTPQDITQLPSSSRLFAQTWSDDPASANCYRSFLASSPGFSAASGCLCPLSSWSTCARAPRRAHCPTAPTDGDHLREHDTASSPASAGP